MHEERKLYLLSLYLLGGRELSGHIHCLENQIIDGASSPRKPWISAYRDEREFYQGSTMPWAPIGTEDTSLRQRCWKSGRFPVTRQ